MARRAEFSAVFLAPKKDPWAENTTPKGCLDLRFCISSRACASGYQKGANFCSQGHMVKKHQLRHIAHSEDCSGICLCFLQPKYAVDTGSRLPNFDLLSKLDGGGKLEFRKLAAVTIARIVYLFDESGALKEKFATKPADPRGSKLYIVVGMVFSPDSTKLAIGQSDDIIFIYKLGLEWGEKKSICNKFQQTLPINSMIWPHSNQIEIMFGLSDGKVKDCNTLHSHGACSPVVSLACNPDGCTCLAGHLDGSIYRFSLDKTAGNFAAKFADYGSVPTVLGWGKNVVLAAGLDSKVALYDFNGAIAQIFDCDNEKGFNSVTFNCTGDIVVLGCYNGFHTFQISGLNDVWEDFGWHEVRNLYTVSADSWKPDGRCFFGENLPLLDNYGGFAKLGTN